MDKTFHFSLQPVMSSLHSSHQKSSSLHEIVFLKLKLDLRGGSCIIFTISIISLADALFLFHKILIAVNLETARSVSGRAHFNTLGLTVFFGLNP